MKTAIGRLLVGSTLLMALFFAGSLLHADEFDSMFPSQDTSGESMGGDNFSSSKWELTIAPTYALLVGKKFEGISYSNGPAAEGSLFYQVCSFCQIGLEGGYSFGHNDRNSLFTFEGIEFLVESRLDVAHITPALKLGSWGRGPWSRQWRPYVQVGAGWYDLIQTVSLKVEGNQFLGRIQLNDVENDYLGANAGAGLECEVYPQGIVGIHVAYHRVFSRPDNLQFLSPSLRLAYLF